MRRELIYLFTIVAIAILFISVLIVFYKPDLKSENLPNNIIIDGKPEKIIIYEKSEEKNYTILQSEDKFDELFTESMIIINSINCQLKLAMTYEKLNETKNRVRYVELIFPDDLNVTTKYGAIKMKEATIILSGEYDGYIFTHEKNARGVGVWSSAQSVEKLNNKVETIIAT